MIQSAGGDWYVAEGAHGPLAAQLMAKAYLMMDQPMASVAVFQKASTKFPHEASLLIGQGVPLGVANRGTWPNFSSLLRLSASLRRTGPARPLCGRLQEGADRGSQQRRGHGLRGQPPLLQRPARTGAPALPPAAAGTSCFYLPSPKSQTVPLMTGCQLNEDST